MENSKQLSPTDRQRKQIELEFEIKNLGKKVDDLEIDIQGLKKDNQDSRIQRIELQKKVDSLKDKIEDIKTHFTGVITELDKSFMLKVQNMENKINGIQNYMNTIEKKVDGVGGTQKTIMWLITGIFMMLIYSVFKPSIDRLVATPTDNKKIEITKED